MPLTDFFRVEASVSLYMYALHSQEAQKLTHTNPQKALSQTEPNEQQKQYTQTFSTGGHFQTEWPIFHVQSQFPTEPQQSNLTNWMHRPNSNNSLLWNVWPRPTESPNSYSLFWVPAGMMLESLKLCPVLLHVALSVCRSLWRVHWCCVRDTHKIADHVKAVPTLVPWSEDGEIYCIWLPQGSVTSNVT